MTASPVHFAGLGFQPETDRVFALLARPACPPSLAAGLTVSEAVRLIELSRGELSGHLAESLAVFLEEEGWILQHLTVDRAGALSDMALSTWQKNWKRRSLALTLGEGLILTWARGSELRIEPEAVPILEQQFGAWHPGAQVQTLYSRDPQGLALAPSLV